MYVVEHFAHGDAGAGVVGFEGERLFELGLRLGEAALSVEDDAEVIVVLWVVGRLLESVEIGMFGLGE